MLRFCLGLLLLTLMSVRATAQIAPDPISDNAGARYVHWVRRIDPAVATRLKQIESSVPKFKSIKQGKDSVTNPAEIRASLQRSQTVIAALMEAGLLADCRFEFPANEAGKQSKLTTEITAQMVSAGHLLHADACRAWQDEDMEGCAGRMAALIGLSRHMMHGTSQDSLSVIQGAKLLEVALKSLDEFDTFGAPLKGELRKGIEEALSRFPEEDPFGIRSAWRSAWRASSERLRAQLDADEISRDFIRAAWDVRARSIKLELSTNLQRTKGTIASDPPEFEVALYMKGYRIGVEAAQRIETVWVTDQPLIEMEEILSRVNEEPTGFAVAVVGLYFDGYQKNLKLAKQMRKYLGDTRSAAAK
jgi:hypothetical protein